MMTQARPTTAATPAQQATSTPESPGQARYLTLGFARHLGGETAEDAILVVSELVTNAIEHAGCTRPALTLSLYADRLTIEVTDTDPTTRVRIEPPADTATLLDLEEGGRGMSLVHALSGGRCGTVYEETTKTVWCSLEIKA